MKSPRVVGGTEKRDAGARRIGFRLGAHAAHDQAGGAAGVGQHGLVVRVVGRALHHLLKRLRRLVLAIHRAQRIGHDQQAWNGGRVVVGADVVLPRRIERVLRDRAASCASAR